MKNFKQSGYAISVLAPYDVQAGDPMLVNGLFGVAQDTVKTGEKTVMNREGVFGLKKAAEAIALTDLLYFNPSTKVVTKTTATGTVKIGRPLAIAASDAPTVDVLLIPNLEAAST